MNEKNIQTLVMNAVSIFDDCRMFRNNVGLGYCGKVLHRTPRSVLIDNPRKIRYGLFPGSSDLIGWKSVEITPDMVGQRVAIFTSIEVKSQTGRESPKQANWLERVQYAGGIAGVARSAEDAVKLLKGGK